MTIDAPGLPMRRGALGEAVADLQQRLGEAGFITADPSGSFDESTDQAVRAFQSSRGITVDGVCGRDTWASLVEAGWRLGDRLLYLRRPMLRGDDVGDLQRMLGALGFDADRVDSIFGDATSRALKEFQRNTAITPDGVCGPDALAALARLGAMADAPATASNLRERESLLDARGQLSGRRVAVAQGGGVDPLVRAMGRALDDVGAISTFVSHPDPSVQAVDANNFKAEVFVTLAVCEEPLCRVAYYATVGFESIGGHHLADLIAAAAAAELHDTQVVVEGMRLPALRETRMPAVSCQIGPTEVVVRHAPALAKGIVNAIRMWSEDPVERP